MWENMISIPKKNVYTVNTRTLNSIQIKIASESIQFADYIEYKCYEYPILKKNKKQWISICVSYGEKRIKLCS